MADLSFLLGECCLVQNLSLVECGFAVVPITNRSCHTSHLIVESLQYLAGGEFSIRVGVGVVVLLEAKAHLHSEVIGHAESSISIHALNSISFVSCPAFALPV